MPYEYFSDEDHLREWLTVEKDSEKFKDFLNRNIYGCADHEEYIALNGGSRKMRELRAKEMLIYREE